MANLLRISAAYAFILVVCCYVVDSARASVGLEIPEATGDYNNDGVVDIADYPVWRDNLGSDTALPNDDDLGTPIGADHYDLWKSSFGFGSADNTFAFENPDIWSATDYDPVPSEGLEQTPPGPDSIFFMDEVTATVVLSEERSGNNGTQKLGTMAVGAGAANEIATLILDADVTFTGQERAGDGSVSAGLRGLRVGRGDTTPGDDNFPWGVVKQTSGTMLAEFANDPAAGSLKLSGDNKDPDGAAGSIWEVGGTASFSLPAEVTVGSFRVQASSPGSIFRVRGSDVGSVDIGTDLKVNSLTGLWDVDTPEEYGGRTRFNRGKSVLEFVLDDQGVTPIEVNGDLRVGQFVPTFLSPTGEDEFSLGFLRVMLSEPTTAGSGEVGSGDELVLIRSDLIRSDGINTATELDEGRFFDPDRDNDTGDPATSAPHRFLTDGATVIADYAGATYEWTINYLEGAMDDGVVEDAIVLSNLEITGTPGDLSGDGSLGAEDRDSLLDAIAMPPTIGLGDAQNLFDLNADGLVDELDLGVFDTHFAVSGNLAAAQVPEPASIAIAGLGLVSFALRRRR